MRAANDILNDMAIRRGFTNQNPFKIKIANGLCRGWEERSLNGVERRPLDNWFWHQPSTAIPEPHATQIHHNTHQDNHGRTQLVCLESDYSHTGISQSLHLI